MQIQILFLCFLQIVSSLKCSKKTTRQEWRQLSTTSQQQAYLSAVTKLKARAPGPETDFSNWNYDQFAILHYTMKDNNHGNRPFFPWHRLFTFYFEKALRTVDPSVTLPWWDWAHDSQNPTASALLQANAFGGDGDPVTHCINSGISSGWKSVAGPSDVVGGCVKRQFSFTGLWPAVAIGSMLSNATDYDTVFHGTENGPHGSIHMQLGGEAGDFSQMWSMNDALFMIHHGMADKTWWLWQNSCQDFATMYSGSPSDPLPPFTETVGDVFDVSSCYDYSRSTSNEIPLQVKCPSGPATDPYTKTSGGTTPPPPNNATVSVTPAWLQNSIITLVFNANTQAQQIQQTNKQTRHNSKMAISEGPSLTCLQNIVHTNQNMGDPSFDLASLNDMANAAIAEENKQRGC